MYLSIYLSIYTHIYLYLYIRIYIYIFAAEVDTLEVHLEQGATLAV